jgi:hypothetical protein
MLSNLSTDTLPGTRRAPEIHAIIRRDLLRIARNSSADHGLYRRGCRTGTGSLVVEYCDSRVEVPITHDDVGFPRGVEIPLAPVREFDLLVLIKWLCPTIACWGAPAALQD